jgi:hypothetical protein
MIAELALMLHMRIDESPTDLDAAGKDDSNMLDL